MNSDSMWIILVLYILFLFLFSVTKTTGLAESFLKDFSNIPHYDKIAHFLLIGILAFLVLQVFSPILRKKYTKLGSILLPLLVITIVIGLEEFSQKYISSRSCSWVDFLAGVGGILLSATVYLLICRRKTVF